MSSRRNAELAKIHIAKKQLGLSDADYRALLMSIANVDSAADLDAAGRAHLLDHFQDLGFKPSFIGQPHNLHSGPNQRQLQKIGALLTEYTLPWSYANGIAKQMFHVERVAMCSSAQLGAVITALVKRGKGVSEDHDTK
ncbi:MAG: regulatory protein GemA [Pseudomonadota bacterium]